MKRSAPLVRATPLTSRHPMSRGTSKLKAIGVRGKRMRSGKVAPNKEEQAWMDAIVDLGCIVCLLFHHVRTPGAVHHILDGGRRKGHLFSLCLCDPGHHQNAQKDSGKISRHPYKTRFEEAYGTEEELLQRTRELIHD